MCSSSPSASPSPLSTGPGRAFPGLFSSLPGLTPLHPPSCPHSDFRGSAQSGVLDPAGLPSPSAGAPISDVCPRPTSPRSIRHPSCTPSLVTWKHARFRDSSHSFLRLKLEDTEGWKASAFWSCSATMGTLQTLRGDISFCRGLSSVLQDA